MKSVKRVLVTGAFSYTGKYITRNLLSLGYEVITLTGHPSRAHPFGDQVKAYPYHFDNPGELTEILQNVSTLYNTYWIRFNYGETTFEKAILNSKKLFEAACQAGVSRIVHVSITNPSVNSPLPYFRGKAIVESALKELGTSYAIIRPTVIFGKEDILINNIAYLLRRFPVFVIPGNGEYQLQPVYVEDFARIAVEAGSLDENTILDAVGPETLTFNELVIMIAEAIASRARIIHMHPTIAYYLSRIISIPLGDVLLTRDEMHGLMADLLCSDQDPTGSTSIKDWVLQNADRIGKIYASELKRHYQ